ncbi:MAG: OmpA family protein [Candidatus Contendobacter sp.]|nr:OmpA family protein [Candidatus Contendobacter sp.]
MAQDIEPNPSVLGFGASARLCNFATNSSRLLASHQQWLQRHALAALRTAPTSLIRLAGIASRLGSARHNEQLALRRAQATAEFIEQQMQKSLSNLEIASYGESISGGGARDDDGYYRAVIVVVSPFPVAPPLQKRAPVPEAPFNRLPLARKRELVEILKSIHPRTSAQYGVLLDAWLRTAATDAALVQILKSVNPLTSGAYAPLLDAWVRQRGDLQQFVTILKLIDPLTAVHYGPLLDAWGRRP